MLCQYVAYRTNTDHCGAPPGKRIDGSGERPVALPPLCEVAPCPMPNISDGRAARALRLAKELFDALTRERLQDLAAHYLLQAIELESGGRTAPPDIDPTE